MSEWKWILVLLVMGATAHNRRNNVHIYHGHLLVDSVPRSSLLKFINHVLLAMYRVHTQSIVSLSEVDDSQWIIVRHHRFGSLNDLTSYGNIPTTMVTIIPRSDSRYDLKLQYCRSNMDCQSQEIAIEHKNYLYDAVSAIDAITVQEDNNPIVYEWALTYVHMHSPSIIQMIDDAAPPGSVYANSPGSWVFQVILLLLGIGVVTIFFYVHCSDILKYVAVHAAENIEDESEEKEVNYHHPKRQELVDKIARLTAECARDALPDENTFYALLTVAERDYQGDQELIAALTELETVITERMDLPPDKECCFCRTWPKTHVIIPCGHIALCLLCTRRQKFKKCLVCNTETTGIYRTYD